MQIHSNFVELSLPDSLPMKNIFPFPSYSVRNKKQPKLTKRAYETPRPRNGSYKLDIV